MQQEDKKKGLYIKLGETWNNSEILINGEKAHLQGLSVDEIRFHSFSGRSDILTATLICTPIFINEIEPGEIIIEMFGAEVPFDDFYEFVTGYKSKGDKELTKRGLLGR